jgi:pimeloyl-ACP methyl ester carboxylesterase
VETPTSFTPAHRGGAGPPLLLLHGFTDTWRTWELVLPALEREHEVLAPTLPGHAGGPDLPPEELTVARVADELERVLDDSGWQTAHIAGNSLGGHLALQLAARGRARSVVALAPAGGWADGDPSYEETMRYFASTQEALQTAARFADALAATPESRRQATRSFTERSDHLSPGLVAHLIRGAAACTGAHAMLANALRDGWHLDAERIACPVRIVWGTADRLLPWPGAAARLRTDRLPHADWVELDGVGHCPQLDVPLEAAQLILGFTR